jgi:hypothetical protein
MDMKFLLAATALLAGGLTVAGQTSPTPDPFREVDGKPIAAKGSEWAVFGGRVVGVSPDGVFIDGTYYTGGMSRTFVGRYFVANFPYVVAEGEVLSSDLKYSAKLAGTRNWTNAYGAWWTFRSLDYGKVWTPVKTANASSPQQKEAASAASAVATKKKSELAARTLKWHQELAAKGDALGQYEMGKRYLRGDGVEKDPAQAKALFEKSAAQGNTLAVDALERLKTEPNPAAAPVAKE